MADGLIALKFQVYVHDNTNSLPHSRPALLQAIAPFAIRLVENVWLFMQCESQGLYHTGPEKLHTIPPSAFALVFIDRAPKASGIRALHSVT